MKLIRLCDFVDQSGVLADIEDARYFARKLQANAKLDFSGVVAVTSGFLDALLENLDSATVYNRLVGASASVSQALEAWCSRAVAALAADPTIAPNRQEVSGRVGVPPQSIDSQGGEADSADENSSFARPLLLPVVIPRGPSGPSRSGGSRGLTASEVVALGEARSPAAVPVLVRALMSRETNIRRLAASAFGKIGHESGVPALSSLLEVEPHRQVRQYAAKALGVIGSPRARPILRRIASDPGEVECVKVAAQHALEACHGTRDISGIAPQRENGTEKVDAEAQRLKEVTSSPSQQGQSGASSEPTTMPTAVEHGVPAGRTNSWLESVIQEYRRISERLVLHGLIEESEVAQLLGGARKARRFARDLDIDLPSLPFGLRIEAGDSGKRWVREWHARGGGQ